MRFGIIGTGRIAGRFVPECLAVPGTEITAVYNPHSGSPERFIEKIWKEKPEEERPDGLSDIRLFFDTVDAVYIASPHETHFGYIMEALRAGKHVLCEKPMVLKSSDASEAFDLAREKGLVLMEGIKSAFCPGYNKLLEVAESGIIGELRYLEACFTKLENPERRELTDLRYGGSFTELGSYVMLPAFDLFGDRFEKAEFESILSDKGMDLFTRAGIKYENAIVSLTCGLGVKSEGRFLIGGTEGYIIAEAPWWKTSNFTVHFEDPSKTVEYSEEFLGDGLRYEIAEFIRFTGDTEHGAYRRAEKRSTCLAGMMERFLNERGNR